MITALLLAVPTPTPGTTGPPAEAVTPGVPGFLALFFLALVVVALGTGMARRVRRVDYRARIEAQERAEAAERARAAGNPHEAGHDAPAGPEDAGPDGGPRPGRGPST